MDLPGVEMVAASDHTIGFGYSGQGIRKYGEPDDKTKFINEYRLQPGLCGLYRFNLLQGRFFDPDRLADRSCIILNESAVRMLGSTPEAIMGEFLVMHSDPLEVIGVVEDFLYRSAAIEVEPMALTAYSDKIRSITVRIPADADPRLMLDRITETIRSFDNSYVMLNFFAREIYEDYYVDEQRLQNIMGAGSILAVIIVLLGIYALVSHNIISRTKEIGIRKVMGGTTTNMMTLIYASTLKWTAIATLLAIPPAWLYLNNWLNGYTIRIPIHWWIFAGAALVVVLFQTLITLGQTLRTARRNPVESLRYE
jgi:putative ABC transport system permease protein